MNKIENIFQSIMALFAQNGIIAKEDNNFWSVWLSFLYDPNSGEIATLLDWELYKEQLIDLYHILPQQSEVIDMEFIDTYQCYQLPIFTNLHENWKIISIGEINSIEWENTHPDAIDVLDLYQSNNTEIDLVYE